MAEAKPHVEAEFGQSGFLRGSPTGRARRASPALRRGAAPPNKNVRRMRLPALPARSAFHRTATGASPCCLADSPTRQHSCQTGFFPHEPRDEQSGTSSGASRMERTTRRFLPREPHGRTTSHALPRKPRGTNHQPHPPARTTPSEPSATSTRISRAGRTTARFLPHEPRNERSATSTRTSRTERTFRHFAPREPHEPNGQAGFCCRASRATHQAGALPRRRCCSTVIGPSRRARSDGARPAAR